MSSSAPVLYVAEPPATYLHKPVWVIDCSVMAGFLFQEPWKEQAQAQMTGRSLHAPYLLPHEICSVALKKSRRGAALAANEGLAQWKDMAIELHGIDLVATLALAQQYQLSAYDASYLWLAAELKCPLATFDEQLAQAAKRHLASLG